MDNPFFPPFSVDPSSGQTFTFHTTPVDYVPQEGERASDHVTDNGKLVLEAFSNFETQADGSQKEIWYVP